MNDYALIKETIDDYFEKYMAKDRKRLETSFSLGSQLRLRYWKHEEGKQLLFSSLIDEPEELLSPYHTPYGSGKENIRNVHIFSKNGATVTLDFGGRFIDRKATVNAQLGRVFPHSADLSDAALVPSITAEAAASLSSIMIS